VTVIGAWLFPVSQGFTQKIPAMSNSIYQKYQLWPKENIPVFVCY
jgi:hypothetical protein